STTVTFTNVTLPVTGTYSLLIDPGGAATGHATVAVTSSGNAPVNATSAGTVVLAGLAGHGTGSNPDLAPRRGPPPGSDSDGGDDSDSWTPDRGNLAGQDWSARRPSDTVLTLPPLT